MSSLKLYIQLLRYVARDNTRQLTAVIALIVIGGFVELVGVATIFPFLSILNQPNLIHEQAQLSWLYESGDYSSERGFILHLGVLSLAFFIGANVFMFAKNAYISRFSLGRTAKIAVELMRSYLARPYSFFLDANTGDIGKNVISQSDSVANGVLLSLFTVLSETLVLAALIGLIVLVEPQAGLVVVALFGSVIAASQYFLRQKLYSIGRRNDTANSSRYRACVEILQSAKEVKASRKEEFFCGMFSVPAHEFAKTYAESNVMQMVPTYAIQTLAGGMLLAVALGLLLMGRPLASIVPLISLYAVAGYRLLPSVTRLTGALSHLRQYQPILENVLSMLPGPFGEKPDSYSAGQAVDAAANPCIAIERISFRYKPHLSKALDDVSMLLPPRRFIALAGASGAGKSTLADVLLGLLSPDSGIIRIGERPLDGANVAFFRELVAYVPQNGFFLDTTIAENIAFGVPPGDIDHALLREAASLAHLDDVIADIPGGFNALIGERGAKLSGGQRQRLAIARALYRRPRILILDESTSALDGATEQTILQTLNELKKTITILAIAHKEPMLKTSDEVYFMEKGRVVGHGPYNQLLASDSRFADLMAKLRV